MIQCPECGNPLTRQTGGNTAANGTRSSYRYCGNEDCSKYQETARMKKYPGCSEEFDAWVDERDLSLSPRVALRLLRMKVRDDREWFNETTEETRQFARQTFSILF